ncbi:MAG: hypothetical protein DWQ07_11855 [Chloroflexi bacterium]|nr:MAG: hypothetical protein DWQ07_11855 [Chloroflexota bacterium]
MSNLYEIPQRTRLLAILSPNATVFSWVLGAAPSCLFLFFPPALLCTMPIFIGLSAVGAYTGWRARKEMAEGVSDPRMNWIAGVGMVLGIVSVVIGILASIGIVLLFALGIGFTVFGNA